jgi:glycerophosphoryl diester phosphodiesterase
MPIYPYASLIAASLLVSLPCASAQQIIAHRGASHDAPENTLAAFRLAWEQGADGIEADFHLTSDGRIVCIHDDDTERVAGRRMVVKDTPCEVLRGLDVGSWKDPRWAGERIPIIDEVFALVPGGKKIFIELKTGPEIVAPLAEAMAASELSPRQMVIISFNSQTVAECKQRLRTIKVHWLTSYEETEDGAWKPSVTEIAETLRQSGADGLGTKAVPEYVDEAFLNHLRGAGMREFHVWTVNDPVTARWYRQLGTWSITTDRPGWLRGQLAQSVATQPER